jgi:hypothetical protein
MYSMQPPEKRAASRPRARDLFVHLGSPGHT